MALTTVDAYGNPTVVPFLATNPPPNPTADTTPYFHENKSTPSWLFQENGGINRNLIHMLAGMGAEMDPRGAGGILGRGTMWYTEAQAAQEAYGAQQKRSNDFNRQVFDMMNSWPGQMSPKGRKGLTKLEVKPDGSLNAVGNITDDIPDAGSNTIAQPTPTTQPPTGTPVPTDTAPDGTPINPIGYKSTIDPRLKQQLDAIPIPTVPRPSGRPAQAPLRPGDALAAPQSDTTPNPNSSGLPANRRPVTEVPQTMPKVQVTAPRYNAPVVPTAPEPAPIPVIPRTQPPADNQTLLPPTTGTVVPVNTAALLPTTRRRSQTMYDLRDVIPF